MLLEPEARFDYRSGQFLTLVRKDGLARSYSIASLPGRERMLELHVRVLAAGRMSRWLAEEARPGDRAAIQGPSGDCFYTRGNESQPLVLVGTGTGLAPLFGITKDAVHHGHKGPIALFHGALEPAGLYLVDKLRELQRQVPRFRYIPCCLEGNGQSDVEVGPLDQVMFKEFSSFEGCRVYLCGDPGIVNSLRKAVFLRGARMKEIFSDAFVTAPSAAS